MIRLSVFLLVLLPNCSSFSQEHQLRGEVQNEAGEKMKDELVYLFKASDSSLVKTEFTDEKGSFVFSQVKASAYFVRIKNADYEQFVSSTFDLGANLELATIVLKAKLKDIDEVAVVGKKKFIEREPGKMIVNVEQSLSATGSSAFEVIERSPGVFVSINDQISVNGKQGIIVQVNGKRLQLAGTDLANYLRGIPSSSIERIEFITNPSSKYDAVGAIIIDIRLKKDTRYGTNGTLTSSYGQGVYPKTNLGLVLNHRTKKVNFYSNYSFAYRKAFNHLVLERRFYSNDTFQLAYMQDNYLTFPFKNHILRTGVDIQVDSVSTLSIVANGVTNFFNPSGSNVSDVMDANMERVSSFATTNQSFDKWYSGGLNLNWNRQTDTLGSTYVIDADYAAYGNKTEQNFNTRYLDLSGNDYKNPYTLYGDLKGSLSIYAIKFDRSKKNEKGSSFDYGLKSSYVLADNDLQFYDRSNGQDVYDTTKSNHFIYTENINAAYVSYAFEKNKMSYQLGLRAENTNITGNQLVYDQRFDTSYVQLFPSVSMRYAHNQKHAFDFNINRRIDRPSYKQLNPFKFYLDPTTYSAGNPYLRPQTTYTAEVGHSYKDQIYTLLGFARTYDNITEIIAPSPEAQNITVQSNINLKFVDLYYLNFSWPFDVKKWWNVRIDMSTYVALYNGSAANTQINNNGSLNGNINLVNQFKINKNHSFELLGNWRTKEVYAFDTIRPIWFVGFSYQAKLLKNKATLRLNVTDAFFTNQITANVTFTDYREHFVVARETRVATIAFTYRFGSAQNGARRRAGGAEELKQRVGQGN